MTRLPITAVVLQWKRAANVREIVAELSSFCDERIVWNNNPDDVFLHPAAKTVNCSADFGLYTRFNAALLARNEAIWMQDDDLLASRETVASIYERWRRRPTIVHGLFGRNPRDGADYDILDVTGPCKIVLTRACMFDRRMASDFFRVAGDPRIAAVRELCRRSGVVEHNGEDILLSYVARLRSGTLNEAHSLPASELPPGPEWISAAPAHCHVRTAMLRACEAMLAEGATGQS